MNTEEFTVQGDGATLKCTLASPEPSLISAESSLLMNISATAHHALHDPGQNHPTQPFLDAGHYVITFDLPHHGERVGEYGESTLAWGKAYLAGDDPFEQFIADGKAALDACIERGIGTNGKIVSYGVSRAGYCLLRLAASDPRVRAVAGLSPVTDWAVPEEFTRSCPQTHTWPLRIDRWVEALADRYVYLSIGAQDDVVGTEACVRFAMKLNQQQRRALPADMLLNQLHVVNSPGHSPGRFWRHDATRFLLECCERL
ncbi:MAG: hypothetical protein CMJ49_07835 [Planctomycetaceae bacterium]|nr:hypothetical protein [Planctomycetaceae bacterium]